MSGALTSVKLGILESFYQTDIDNVFSDFDKDPLASGAIAQVYKAVLYDPKQAVNREVIIKVRHPHVVDNIAIDLRILRTMASAVCNIHQISALDG